MCMHAKQAGGTGWVGGARPPPLRVLGLVTQRVGAATLPARFLPSSSHPPGPLALLRNRTKVTHLTRHHPVGLVVFVVAPELYVGTKFDHSSTPLGAFLASKPPRLAPHLSPFRSTPLVHAWYTVPSNGLKGGWSRGKHVLTLSPLLNPWPTGHCSLGQYCRGGSNFHLIPPIPQQGSIPHSRD